MIVYSSNFEFESNDYIENIIKLISKWVGQRSKTYIDPIVLGNGLLKRRLNDGSTLISRSTQKGGVTFNYPFLFSAEFSHGDDKVPGRLWTTGIGLRQTSRNSPIECTFLLKTDEISTRVKTTTQSTRPRIVLDVLSNCNPIGGCIGSSIKQLDETSAPAFLVEIEREKRFNPIVIISAKRDGTYIIEPEKLRSLLIGIADIVQIKSNVDTFSIEKILSRKYSAWNGAINILFGSKYVDNVIYCDNALYTPDRMVELIESGIDMYSEIFSAVTHHTNVPASWKHISIQMVEQIDLQNKLRDAKESASNITDGESYIPLLESAMDQLSEKEKEIVNLRSDMVNREEQCQSLEYQVQSLKYSLVGRQQSGAVLDAADLGAITALRELFGAVLDEQPDLEQSLSLIQTLFPDRIIILESAFESARESINFRYGNKGFELLWDLAFKFWPAINQDSDLAGKRLLGEKYAQNEGNALTATGKRRRTFKYKEQEILMEKHLKFGVKDSISETLRIYFEWIGDEKLIVIGHCGKHLDH